MILFNPPIPSEKDDSFLSDRVAIQSQRTTCFIVLANNNFFSGTKTRTRSITTQSSCSGKSCPALKQTTSCSQYNNRDCVMSAWSSWSICSNGCGSGWSTRTRNIVTSALCRGKACGTRSERKQCTDYRDNRDCVVSCKSCRSLVWNRVCSRWQVLY